MGLNIMKPCNSTKIIEYLIIKHPLTGLLKIISASNFTHYTETELNKTSYSMKCYWNEDIIICNFFGDIKYAKYMLHKHIIDRISTHKNSYIRWNTKPNTYHSQRYTEKYCLVLHSFDKHTEKVLKLVNKYETDNPYMIV